MEMTASLFSPPAINRELPDPAFHILKEFSINGIVVYSVSLIHTTIYNCTLYSSHG
jgi:hypothetical protein